MLRKNYRNNRIFFKPHKKYNNNEREVNYYKNQNNNGRYKDGRNEETRIIIDRSFEDNAPYLRYDLQNILNEPDFRAKADIYQECRILRLKCQFTPLKRKGVVTVYYNDFLNEMTRHVFYPIFKPTAFTWHNIRNNRFEFINTAKLGSLCFVNKDELRLKCQIRVVIIFRGKKNNLKGINWKDIDNDSAKNDSDDISSIKSVTNKESSSFSFSISKADTSFKPSGNKMVDQNSLDSSDINDFSRLMVNRLVRSYEEFLDDYYLRRRKAKNSLDKEKKKFNKLAGQLKDVNRSMKNEIELIKSGLIEEKVEEHVKNLKGTIALVNSKIKQYDEKFGQYSNVDMDLQGMKMMFTKMVQDIVKLQNYIRQIAKECRDNSNKISILQDTKKDDDDYDLESDFLSGYTINDKKNCELFDDYNQAELYMKEKYKKAKERRLHKIVYDKKIHKYKIE